MIAVDGTDTASGRGSRATVLLTVTWAWLLLVLAVGARGLAAVYRDTSLIRIDEFSAIYERVGLADEFMITILVVLPLGVAVVSGAVLAIRKSEDRAALLFAMCLTAVYFFTSGAASGIELVWLRNGMTSAATVLIAVFLVTFPSGSFLPRWSVAAPVAALVIAAGFPALAANTRRYLISSSWQSEGVPLAAWGGWSLVLIIAAAAQVTRYRRFSTRIERNQSRWVLLGAFGMLAPPAALLALNAAGSASPGTAGALVLLTAVGSYVLPAAVLIAVFRHHLYDIDAFISRTLTYSLVAMVVATAFTVPVLGFASVFGTANDLVVAGSTLLAAAIANPARRRIHRAVDRRFNRTRYDAEQVLGLLADRLRSDVSLDSVSDHLEHAVVGAVQPEMASLWIREPS